MKKGLRHAGCRLNGRGVLAFKHRPDEEGIKTEPPKEGLASAALLNIALMKKGLRQKFFFGCLRRLSFKHRPDEEGIKTLEQEQETGVRILLNIALMKKGLRRTLPKRDTAPAPFKHRPDEEGIKTAS